MIYWQLFIAFLQIGAFSFGGGYAAMPLIQEQIIDRYGWMTMDQFTDLIAIAEMTPGPIAVNAATFVGNQMAGPVGALCATAGVILPSCIIVTVLAYLYKKYRTMKMMQSVLTTLRPAVVSMIFSAGLTILVSTVFTDGTVSFLAGHVQWRMVAYFVLAFIALRIWKKVSPIFVMVLCGAAELVFQCAVRYQWFS